MSRTQTMRTRVANSNLIFYGLGFRLLTAFLAGLLGILGFTVSTIAIMLAIPKLFDVPDLLLSVVFIGSYAFALIAVWRNKWIRRIADRGFTHLFWTKQVFELLFWFAAVSAMYGAAARSGWIPEFRSWLSLLLMGLFFLLVTPMLIFGPMITKRREAR